MTGNRTKDSRLPRAARWLSAAFLLLPTLALAGEPSVAKQRRQELDGIRRELFHKTVLVRHDLVAAGPTPGQGRMTELLDGSYYAHADASIAYEALSPVVLVRMALRQDARVLLLTLAPPSNILPPHLRGDLDPLVGVPLLVDVSVEEHGGLREAIASVVYFPGDAPDEEAVTACLSRYPSHDAKRSRLRCGLAAE